MKRKGIKIELTKNDVNEKESIKPCEVKHKRAEEDNNPLS